MCTVLLPPGVNEIAVNIYIIIIFCLFIMIELIQFVEALDQLCYILFMWNFLIFLFINWAHKAFCVGVS